MFKKLFVFFKDKVDSVNMKLCPFYFTKCYFILLDKSEKVLLYLLLITKNKIIATAEAATITAGTKSFSNRFSSGSFPFVNI